MNDGVTNQPTRTTRSELLHRLRAVSAAWSVNGRDVSFTAEFGLPVEPGGFLAVTTPAGVRHLVQVHELHAVTRSNINVEVDTDEMGLTMPGVRSAAVAISQRVVEGAGVVVGRAGELVGFDDAVIEPATVAEIEAFVDDEVGEGLEIGRLRHADVPARLVAKGFARHTFMCGQSGSGKTFSLGVVLERLLDGTDLPVIILDPNSDYVNLGKVTSRAAINRFRHTPMSRADYDDLRERYPARAQVVVASARGGDLPLRIHLSDLTVGEQALAMQLDPIADPEEFHALLDAVGSFGSDPYDVTDVQALLRTRFDDASRRLAQRIANLGIAGWSVWARSDEPSLNGKFADLGARVLVLDTGSLADVQERSVVALALLGRLRRRPHRAPISVVIDEAHNVCPPEPGSALEQAVTDLALWIAGEGRKFGIYLVLSTQRPQKIHRNVLSQCDNLLLMRINSDTDLAELAEVFSHVPAPMIAEARSHRMGEMLAAGRITPVPQRLQMGVRWTKEGGADLPTDWAHRAG